MRINIEDIIIKDDFKNTFPSERKLRQCQEAYDEGVFDRDIVINSKNELVDGYVLYLILKQNDFKGEVEVKRASRFFHIPTTYVFGKHPGDDTERVWYINMSIDKIKDKVGKVAEVDTKHGIQPITITRIERLSNPPVEGKIRKVVLL